MLNLSIAKRKIRQKESDHMKILLIAPMIDPKNKDTEPMLMSSLGLFVLEGLTPPRHKVKVVQEWFDKINLNEECDLVGISCMTATAPRAYELAIEFKKRGKTVVLGGVHPSILPDEALQFADSVIIGEAEEVWGEILADFEKNELKKIYKKPRTNFDKFIPLDYKKLKNGFNKPLPILTTRGCIYKCDFCSVNSVFGKGIEHVSIENIIRHITESKAKYIAFVDDNIICDKEYAKKLFRSLIPLKIRWSSQASISIADDPGLLSLAAKSGCKLLLVGIENISDFQLKKLGKQYNEISDLEEAISRIRKAGLILHAFIMFGFDSDKKEIFQQTVDFLIKNKVCSASFNILTPYPNLKIFEELKKSGRLLTEDWKYYCHNIAVFKPKNMTAYELQLGMLNAKKKFYSFRSIAMRCSGFFLNPLNFLIFLFINFAYRKQIRAEEKWNTRLDLLDFLKK